MQISRIRIGFLYIANIDRVRLPLGYSRNAKREGLEVALAQLGAYNCAYNCANTQNKIFIFHEWACAGARCSAFVLVGAITRLCILYKESELTRA